MENMIISYTTIKTYQFCPIRYQIRYLFHEPEPTTDAVALGIALHEAMALRQQFSNELLDLYTENKILDIYHTATSHVMGFEEFRELFVRMLKASLTIDLPYRMAKLEQEYAKQYRLDDVDVTLVGKVDYQDAYWLIDFKFKKTAYWIEPEQLKFYQFLTGHTGRLGFYIIEYNGNVKFVEVPNDYTYNFFDTIKKIVKNDFFANHNKCKYCPFVSVCKATQEEEEIIEEI